MLQHVLRKMSWSGIRRPVSILFGGGGEVETGETLKASPGTSACECPPNFPIWMPILSRLRTSLHPRRYRGFLLELLPKSKKWEKYKKKWADNPKARDKQLITHFKRQGVDIDDPDPEILWAGAGYLIHMAISANRVEYLEATLALISRSNIQLKEGHYSIILLAMSEYGWHNAVKRNFRKMVEFGIDCRLETLFSIVIASLERKDFEFALEAMQMLVKNAKYKKPFVLFPMFRIVEGCVGEGGEEVVRLVELVLKWYGVVDASLDKKIVDMVVRWIQRCQLVVRKEHQIIETRVLPSGCCEACGENLNAANLPQTSHAALLGGIESLILESEKRHLDQSKSVFPSFKSFLDNRRFGAVLDGMNVASVLTGKFDHQKLIRVAKEMEKRTGHPSLIVLRQHCKKMFPLECSSDIGQFAETYKPTKFFFIYNRVDDDLYAVYAALASGPDTFFVSNDQMGDKVALLPSRALREMLKDWRKSRQVHVEYTKKSVALSMHQRDELNIQWELNKHLHLPYTRDKCMCIKFH